VTSGTRPRYDALIEISTELFAAQGYEATTVRQIADRMGIKSASLYSHVGNKAEILRSIVVDVAHDFDGSAARALSRSRTPEQRLTALCRAHLDVVDRRASAVRVYFHQWRKLSDAYLTEIIGLRAAYEQLFRSAVADGVAEGTFRQVDVGHTVRVLLGALNWTYEWRTPGSGTSPDVMADQILETVVSGLRPRCG
jgi:AcrR family transcriptional regulator